MSASLTLSHFWFLMFLFFVPSESYYLNNEEGSKTDDELIFAHILFRHGDKNIKNTYPNDPYKDESHWPGGFGELTNLGKRQHYELGAYLRQRYKSILMTDGSYNQKNIYVRSTDADRALLSASYNMAGMFPPVKQQIWNDALMWQALPIHSVPVELDHLVSMIRRCPLYDQTYEEYQQSPEIKRILKNNQSVIEYIELHAGIKVQQICHIKYLYDRLMNEKSKGFRLPAWTEKVLFPGSDMEKLARFCCVMPTNSKLMKRLKGGFLIREILDRFSMKINLTLSPDRSLWIYSGHGTSMRSVLNGLELTEPHIPAPASSIFLELHKFNGTFHVEIYYNRNHRPDKVLKPIFIPNCGRKCPLSKMYEIYQDILPTEDFDFECRLPKKCTKRIKS